MRRLFVHLRKAVALKQACDCTRTRFTAVKQHLGVPIRDVVAMVFPCPSHQILALPLLTRVCHAVLVVPSLVTRSFRRRPAVLFPTGVGIRRNKQLMKNHNRGSSSVAMKWLDLLESSGKHEAQWACVLKTGVSNYSIEKFFRLSSFVRCRTTPYSYTKALPARIGSYSPLEG